MTTSNPFDFSSLFTQFDPTAMTKQIQDMFGSYQIPNVDRSAVMQAQSKNIQALTAANRAAVEGTQALLQRQAEMMQQALAEATEAAKAIAASGSPQQAAAEQTALVEKAFEKAIANAAEISEMVKKTQDEAAKLVSARITESLEELKQNIEKLK